MANTLIFAHRGLSKTHPENTMTAFKAARDAGADGLELDVQLTKDHVPVLIHDETVNRTTDGKGWVKDFTYDELRKLDAGSWLHTSYADARIPTLEELLVWASETKLILNIELKSGIVTYHGIEKAVLDLAATYNMTERIIISSFNHYSLVATRELSSNVETAVLFMEGLYEPWNYAKRIGAQSLHCYFPVAVPQLIEGAKRAGTPVRPFTVNDPSHLEAFIRAGCDGIITDNPESAVQIRRRLKSGSQ